MYITMGVPFTAKRRQTGRVDKIVRGCLLPSIVPEPEEAGEGRGGRGLYQVGSLLGCTVMAEELSDRLPLTCQGARLEGCPAIL